VNMEDSSVSSVQCQRMQGLKVMKADALWVWRKVSLESQA